MNNTLYESDFKDNLKWIGNYFKYLFINRYKIDNTDKIFSLLDKKEYKYQK